MFKYFLNPVIYFRFLIIYGTIRSEAMARGGGGGAGGGGGFGGGSHGYGGGQPFSSRDYFGFLSVGAILCVITGLTIWYSKWKVSHKEKKVEQVLKELAPLDREWDEKNLEKVVRSTFFEIQKAWCDQDLIKLKNLLAPSIYKEWEGLIKFYEKMGQKDFMDDLTIDNLLIVEVKNYINRDKDSFSVCIDASAKDYFVDDKGRYFNNGDSNNPFSSKEDIELKKFREYWTYQRKGPREWLLFRIDQEGDWALSVEEPVVNEN
jgi:hypothetical protein